MDKYECTLKDLLERGIGKFTIKINNQDTYLDNSQNILYSQIPSDTLKPKNSKEEKEQDIQDYVNETYINEEQDPKNYLIKILNEKIYEMKGYEILENMNFGYAVAEMMPYLIDIAVGLDTLHQCKLRHLDLKPANIFIRELGGDIQAAIGDLSFLNQAIEPEIIPNPLSGREADLPLGTRHYRSPEQKDHFDVADVEVTKDDRGIKLIINDRKFKDTIIEENDLLRFSKNQKNIYTIKSKKIINSDYCEIRIQQLYPNLDRPSELAIDKKTQVFFEKIQGYRTDLFGFGAIIYDLLTCGESPENFYEKIRIYDRENNFQDDNSNTTKIMQDFEKVSNYQSNEPSLIQIFDSFRLKNNPAIYAPPEIVKLIVECMLYKDQGNFYFRNLKESGQSHKTMKTVWEELLNLTDNINGDERFKVRRRKAQNNLYSKEVGEIKNISSNYFQEEIKKIRQQPKDKLLFRLQKGIWYLNSFADIIINKLQKNDFYIADLNPKNILQSMVNSNIEFNLPIYDNKEKYQKDLKRDFVYTKFSNDIKNFYVPDFIVFMRREIELSSINKFIPPDDNTDSDGSNNQLKQVKFTGKYLFLDSSIYGNHVCKGDWIVIKSSNLDNNKLFRIDNVDNESKTITFTSIDKYSVNDFPEEKDLTKFGIVFYKKFSIEQYYLYMIGIYLYHLFFIGIDGNNYSRPILANILNENCQYVNNIKEIEIDKNKINQEQWFDWTKNKLSKDLQKIVNSLVIMYLRLTFSESKNSFYTLYSKKEKDHSIYYAMVQVKSELEIIRENIAKYLTKHLQKTGAIKNDLKIESYDLKQLDGDFSCGIDKSNQKLELKKINKNFEITITMNFNKLMEKGLSIK